LFFKLIKLKQQVDKLEEDIENINTVLENYQKIEEKSNLEQKKTKIKILAFKSNHGRIKTKRTRASRTTAKIKSSKEDVCTESVEITAPRLSKIMTINSISSHNTSLNQTTSNDSNNQQQLKGKY
jgi:hypothetical protein